MSDYAIGEKLFCAGLDMKCRPTIENVTIKRFLTAAERKAKPEYDCVVRSGSISMYANTNDLYKSRNDAERKA